MIYMMLNASAMKKAVIAVAVVDLRSAVYVRTTAVINAVAKMIAV